MFITPAVAKMIKRFGGWMEGDTARFPTPHQKEQFLKAYDAACKIENDADDAYDVMHRGWSNN